MQKDISFYNTMSKSIEKMTPQDGKTIKMYCCGPTVYNYAHIGNLRTYVFEDILAKTIRLAGYNVKHVMNITDVGHLTSDEDEGEDKMLVAAKREQKSVLDIAKHYETVFFQHTAELGLDRPDVVARATDHIQEMINFVKVLEDKGYAYFSDGNVYFDTSKFKEYGKLSKQDRTTLRHGARVEQDTSKRNPSDFVLWFTSSKFENQVLQWDSPWGRGYPGWHIECSTMAMKYLGDKVDIHCGGIDHIPVHHENELAQSEAYLGHSWVKCWMHAEFLQVKDGKMSKSKGEFLTLDTLKEKGYKPEHYKYFCLMSHYKSPAVFNFESLDGARNSYENLKSKVIELRKEAKDEKLKNTDSNINLYTNRFNEFMFNDLRTPQALSTIWLALKDNSISASKKLEFLEYTDKIFGLGIDKMQATNENQKIDINEDIAKLLEERKIARDNKDWKKSDEIRDRLQSLGLGVKDLPDNKIEVFYVDANKGNTTTKKKITPNISSIINKKNSNTK